MMDVHPRVYNYYALALAICNACYSIDRAIDYFSPPADQPSRLARREMKVEEMLRLRMVGWSNTEIGQIYGGIDKSAVSHLINRHLRRANERLQRR